LPRFAGWENKTGRRIQETGNKRSGWEDTHPKTDAVVPEIRAEAAAAGNTGEVIEVAPRAAPKS